MKLFTVRYKYCWRSKTSVGAIAAEDFADAKKRLQSLLQKNFDIVGYMGVEAWIDKNNPIDFENTLTTLRKYVSEEKVNEYIVKDIIT